MQNILKANRDFDLVDEQLYTFSSRFCWELFSNTVLAKLGVNISMQRISKQQNILEFCYNILEYKFITYLFDREAKI